MNILNSNLYRPGKKGSFNVSSKPKSSSSVMKLKNLKVVKMNTQREAPKIKKKYTFNSIRDNPLKSNAYSVHSPGINININHLNINSFNYNTKRRSKPNTIDADKITSEIMKSKPIVDIIKSGGLRTVDIQNSGYSRSSQIEGNLPKINSSKPPKVHLVRRSSPQTAKSNKPVVPHLESLIDNADDSFVDECKEILNNVKTKRESDREDNEGVTCAKAVEPTEMTPVERSPEKCEEGGEVDLDKMRRLNSKRPQTSYGGAKDRIRSSRKGMRYASGKGERPESRMMQPVFGLQNNLEKINKKL